MKEIPSVGPYEIMQKFLTMFFHESHCILPSFPAILALINSHATQIKWKDWRLGADFMRREKD
jgi:hypothetical protein